MEVGAQTNGVNPERGGKQENGEGSSGCEVDIEDLEDGNVDIAGCVSRRPSHFQSISQGALKRWKIWILEIENAFLQADGFGCRVSLRDPGGWGSEEYPPLLVTGGAGV